MSTVPKKDANVDLEEPTKLPFLRRVRIRGYKSIAFCDVQLAPLTVFVGRNGSGKSNFLDALAFLRDALRFNVSEAVQRHGGYPAILCHSVESPTLSIEVETDFSDHASLYYARYAVTISANQDHRSVSPHEVLWFEDVTHPSSRRFEARQGKVEWSDGGSAMIPANLLYLGVLGERPFPELADS